MTVCRKVQSIRRLDESSVSYFTVASGNEFISSLVLFSTADAGGSDVSLRLAEEGKRKEGEVNLF